jgi:hypothetical protein
MNVSPAISIKSVERLAVRMKDSLLGLILTVKLTNWSFADKIPAMKKRLQDMGMKKIITKQLAANGQEFMFQCLTRKGLARD